LLQLPYNVGCNESVERIPESIYGSYDYVFHYNGGGWLAYSPDIDPIYNTLSTMEGGKQYWVHVTNEDGLRYYLGLPEIEIEVPADGSLLDSLDDISGWTRDSQGGIEEVTLLVYYKNETNVKIYWNGTGWDSTPVELVCNLDPVGDYVQFWSYDSSGIMWNSGETYYIKAQGKDKFGCQAVDLVSFSILSEIPV
jgi:hypothetical protein